MRKSRITAVAAAAAISGLALAGCGTWGQGGTNSWKQPTNDAPVSNANHSYNNPAEVYGMPDGFSNFSEKCDLHGNRVFVVFHGYTNKSGNPPYAAIAVIKDPTCSGFQLAHR